MNYKEYGDSGRETVILLHGGGLSWWNYREAAGLLKEDHHIILPILDGHAGSDRPFTTIESNADEIIAFIDEHFGGQVHMLGGLSLGGQVLLEILSRRGDICKHALVESAMVLPSKLTNALLGPSVACSFPLVKKPWFARLQFKQLRIKDELYEDYYRDTCALTAKDMTAFLKANTAYSLKDTIGGCKADVRVYYGEKEIAGIRKSARLIDEALPNSRLIGLPGRYHADFSVNSPGMYAEAVRSFRQ